MEGGIDEKVFQFSLIFKVEDIFGHNCHLISTLVPVWAVRIGPITLVPIFLLIGTIFGIIVFLITDKDHVPRFHDVSSFPCLFSFFLSLSLSLASDLSALVTSFLYNRPLITADDKLIAGFRIFRILHRNDGGLFGGRRGDGSAPVRGIRFQYVGRHARYYVTRLGKQHRW